MAGNPRIVTADVAFTWDGASQRLPRGQVIDVPAGSALEDAIGPGNLAPLTAPAAVPAAPAVQEPAEAPEPQEQPAEQPAPRARRTVPQDDAGGEPGDGAEAA